MNTTIYLIRHSVRLNKNFIDKFHTTQNKTILNEKICLSIEGEKRAEILSNEKELQNLDMIYTSNCVRTLQTAKYIIEKQHLKVSVDDRFDERRIGKPNDDVVKDWWLRQYLDENYSTEGGESQKDVRNRFEEAFNEVIRDNRGKRVAIFSHGYAITFFIMKWCKFEYLKDDDYLQLKFNGKIIFSNNINAPEVFKLIINDDDELVDISNIRFEDLPYQDGLGNQSF